MPDQGRQETELYRPGEKSFPRGYQMLKLTESACPTAVRVSTPDHTKRTAKRAWEHHAYLWRSQIRYYENNEWEAESGEGQDNKSKDRECLGYGSGCIAS